MRINASDFNLVDLDEFTGCENLKNKIAEGNQELLKNLPEITLDLRGCWLDYGFSHLYLDYAVEILISSPIRPRDLNVLVSVDLGAPEFMAALLFPHSKVLAYTAEMGPSELSRLLNEYCVNNFLRISIVASLSNNESENRNYQFGVTA